MGFDPKLDFKRGKTGSEIKLNNFGRQKKRGEFYRTIQSTAMNNNVICVNKN